LSLCDIVTPNESEAARLTGIAVEDDAGVRAAAEALREQGAATVVMTLGARGVYALGPEGELRVPTFPVKAVDTTAAGDAFSGGLAYGLASGLTLSEALRWGCAAGALACTRAGAVPSLPTQAEALTLLTGAQV
ncbi:MAG TPA: PfkB family carbohydrate kinase, partial [Anaerolineales bacterium]|nr:PfkB family carbohydrate kinase [Anaerolineales bacterium]